MEILNEQNVRKSPVGVEEAWELLAQADQILTARGKTIRRWDPRVDAKDNILADVIGRSGNLRAPAVRVGNTFLIGFHEDMYTTLWPELADQDAVDA